MLNIKIRIIITSMNYEKSPKILDSAKNSVKFMLSTVFTKQKD